MHIMESLLDQTLGRQNMHQAFKRACSNKGTSGIDGITVDEIDRYIEKTRIVYCKDDDRTGNYPNISFDFLGYTFKTRGAKNKYGKYFTNFPTAIAGKAKKAIRKEVRGWKLQLKVDKDLWDIANMFNRQIQGWINYYTHFYKSEMYGVLRYINNCLVRWVRRKYKKRKHKRRAEYWLGSIALRDRNLFAHWKFGVLPTAG